MATERDKEVINLILNPTSPFGGFEAKNAENVDDEKREAETKERHQQLAGYEQSEQHNVQGVAMAEAGDLEGARPKFDEAIRCCPANPRPYNNRAQLNRLASNITEALADLDKALALCEGTGRTAAQSHVQRALIWRLQGDDERAKDEFEKAAKLGSQFAKSQLVAMNPYAAMCNSMLVELMAKFRKGEDEM